MTDLISSLADSIVALINSKPQSPTKDEVESLLRGKLAPWSVPLQSGRTVDVFVPNHDGPLNDEEWLAPPHGPTMNVKWSAQPDPTAGDMPIDAALLERLTHWAKEPEKERGPDACGIPCGHRRIHPELQALRPCPGSTDGSHRWLKELVPPGVAPGPDRCGDCGAAKS